MTWQMIKVGLLPAAFPVPYHNNGFGFHGSAGKSALPSNIGLSPEAAADELVARGVRWVTLVAGGADMVPWCAAMTSRGIMVSVRLYLYQPHPGHHVASDLVAAFVNAGAVYVQVGNEPNLSDEWANGQLPPIYDAVKMTNDQWVVNARTIIGAGGIALYPPLSPGGNIDHKLFYPAALRDLHERYGDEFISWAKAGKTAFAIHNRPLNHPLAYPNDPLNDAEKISVLGRPPNLSDDSCCFRMYEWLTFRILEEFGFTLPLLGTEAGYALWTQDDNRYPRVDPWLHRDWNVGERGIMGGFKAGIWLAELFCQCFWLWTGFGHGAWEKEFWWKNPDLGDTPAYQALPAAVNYEINYEVKALDPIPADIYDALQQAATEHQVEVYFLAAVGYWESGWWREATREEPGLKPVSDWNGLASCPDGSVGIGQILRSNGKARGLSSDAELMDVRTNIGIIAEMLHDNLEAFDQDPYRALAAYNGGQAGVRQNGWEFYGGYVMGVLNLRQRFIDEGMVRGEGPAPIPEDPPKEDWKAYYELAAAERDQYKQQYLAVWADRDRLNGIANQWGNDLGKIEERLVALSDAVSGSIAGVAIKPAEQETA